MGAARGRPGGGPLVPGCGASGVGRSPAPERSSFAACGQGPLPAGCGCGGFGRGDPSPTPQRALFWELALRAVGAARERPGGAPLAWVWGVRGQALSPSKRSSFEACGQGPLPTGCGCGGCGRGDPSRTPQRALLRAGFARCGGQRGCQGGAPNVWVWHVRGRALSHPRPLVLWVVRPGPTTHCLWVRGVWTRGPITNPTARALASLLCALWGRQQGPRGEGTSCLCVGRPRSGARPLEHAAGAGYPLAVGAVCGRGGPAVLGTFSCAAVRCVLGAFPGLAATGGRCGLAPVLVPWL